MTIANPRLRADLIGRAERDQQARHACDDAAMRDVDADNFAFLAPIIDQYGWLHSGMVGDDGAHACWLLVQHSPPAYQDRWLPLLRAAVEHGLATRRDLAYLQDRVDVHHGRPQTYGTQSIGIGSLPPRLWPVTDPSAVDALRDELGLPPLDADHVATAWTSDEITKLGLAQAPDPPLPSQE